jgi:hypothetical protein
MRGYSGVIWPDGKGAFAEGANATSYSTPQTHADLSFHLNRNGCPEYIRLLQRYEASLRQWGHALLASKAQSEIHQLSWLCRLSKSP